MQHSARRELCSTHTHTHTHTRARAHTHTHSHTHTFAAHEARPVIISQQSLLHDLQDGATSSHVNRGADWRTAKAHFNEAKRGDLSPDSKVCCVGGGAQGGWELVCVHMHFLRYTRETCHTPAFNTRSCERDRAYRPDRVKVEGRQNEQVSRAAWTSGTQHNKFCAGVEGQQEWNLRAMRCKEWYCADTPAASLSSTPWSLENHSEAPQLSEGVFSLRFPRTDPAPPPVTRGRLHTSGAPIR
jgi:hypothetical protein